MKRVNHKTFTMGSGNHEVSYRLRDSLDNHGTHNMTNQKRVELEMVNLFSDGQLQAASNEMVTYYIGKREYTCFEIEALDTFQGWKEKGYHVKRGEKAITDIKLYQGYGWRKYYFFSASQVTR